MFNNNKNANNIKKSKVISRRYGAYSETDYNAQICLIKID